MLPKTAKDTKDSQSRLDFFLMLCISVQKSVKGTKKLWYWWQGAIVWALKEWQHYIQGSGHTTTILSDHDNLRHFKVPQTIGQWMARWMLYLSEFDIKLIHIPGKKKHSSRCIIKKTRSLSWRNWQWKCYCPTRTSICQFDQYKTTKKDSKYRKHGLWCSRSHKKIIRRRT